MQSCSNERANTCNSNNPSPLSDPHYSGLTFQNYKAILMLSNRERNAMRMQKNISLMIKLRIAFIAEGILTILCL